VDHRNLVKPELRSLGRKFAKYATKARYARRRQSMAESAPRDVLMGEAEETTVHPTLGVKKLKYASKGHHTWTAEEIEQFNQRHPIGTQARRALDIIRYTSGRREDAPRPGRQHIRAVA
jgi:hypothetical protein